MLTFTPSRLPSLHSFSTSKHPSRPLNTCRSFNVSASMPPPLVIGLNQYSHDASVAIIHATTGQLLFAMSKERLSRRKHHAGPLGNVVETACQAIAHDFNTHVEQVKSAIQLVVANNHHFRINHFENRLAFLKSLQYVHQDYLDDWNLIGREGNKVELSHHLAHAYSAVWGTTFERGVVVVMDGMGDNLDDWIRGEGEDTYYYEGSPGLCQDAQAFSQFPRDVREIKGLSFREAETAYVFRKKGASITFERLFKRWTPEVEPSELPNHSFEEMESVGAVYSRVAAIIFKDWNACGKVMGLAAYAEERMKGKRKHGDRLIIKGHLYDGSLSVSEGKLQGLKHVDKSWCDADTSPQLRRYFEDLAYHVQKDLEDVVTDFISELQKATGEKNLVFAGGVALNSTLNGVLSARVDFDNVYVPPYPGDEGIAIGCAAFGYSKLSPNEGTLHFVQQPGQFLMPYFGKLYSKLEYEQAIESFSPWITWREVDSSLETAKALAESKVVAWFQGQSEFGPRALGNRSILADPRSSDILDFVNKVVKKRESFRPFAPSILAENVHEWFEGCGRYTSPYMSVTKKCTQPHLVPAVVHVDGTSRLQTVVKEHNPVYHGMISHFRDLTGIPMVLNTSFNVAGEPIVESPQDAVRTFLTADGIDKLVFPGIIIEKKNCSVIHKDDLFSSACSTFRSHQVQDSSGSSLRTSVSYISSNFCGCGSTSTMGLEHSLELIDSLQLEILETIHTEGPCLVASLLEAMGAVEYESDDTTPMTIQDGEVPSATDVLDRLRDLFQKLLIFKT